MRILIVENLRSTSLGQVGAALDEAKAEQVWVRPWNTEALPASSDGFDGMVVLGGEQSAIDDHIHPYLPELARLMKRFGDDDKAVLGICLGSQLLARAYGGSNILGQSREFGWHRITVTDAAKDDPVLGAAGADFPIFEWHNDTFTLPENAVHLARSATVSHQCFRIGRASYGMQFHFEASRTVVEQWKADFAETIERLSPGWLADYESHAATDGVMADATGLDIARAWLRQVIPDSIFPTQKAPAKDAGESDPVSGDADTGVR